MEAERIKEALQYRKLIDVLCDENQFADVVLEGGYVINTVTREILEADVAIKGEHVLMVGDCKDLIGKNTKVQNVRGKFVSPGFIDAHMHFESSMLTCTEFSRLSIPTGTTGMVCDPHEIGNVLGINGMKAMIEEARTLPNQILFTIPAMVPDAPGLETAGEDVNSTHMKDILPDPLVRGIGEIEHFANIQPVYENAPHIIDDLIAAVSYCKGLGKTVEGNAPQLFGKDLAAHIIGGGNHVSCHETTTKEETMEKLRYGVTVHMREGSSQRNMADCVRAVTEEGMDSRRLTIVTDDVVAEDLLRDGHMNEVIRRAIAVGVDPVEAIQMTTINPAQHFGLDDVGFLAPGKRANIAIIDDLNEMTINSVYLNGVKASEGNDLLIELGSYTYPESVKNSVKCDPISVEDLHIPARGNKAKVRSLVAIPFQNLTNADEFTLNVENGVVQPCLQQDVLPVFVIERHGRTSNIGKGFLNGFKLKEGAIAESVAHNTHNIIVTGTNYEDMVTAVNRVIAMGGGIAMIKDGKVVGDLELNVGGLITDKLDAQEVSEEIAELTRLAKDELGCEMEVPFMHLSFWTLVTSPDLKITDYGLIDVKSFEILDPVIE
ncbi:MAG TPA: adenine deaminase C-terminal domain-containing protein [Bacillota bacterium]|nr:adenine deaminase C-terminal domain-containing protein [Bacillota bacterium]